MKLSQDKIDRYWLEGIKRGWRLICFQKNIGMISFGRKDQRINIYLTTGTVATSLCHPTKQNKQLYRKNLSFREIKKLLINPRLHTGKGYYTT
jgi:ABC-type uncharacterized transport system permease subunit